MNFSFFINSIAFGIGLAMDAFSVSLANGLNEPRMKKTKMCAIAGTYCFFQIVMPLIGWICVHTVAEKFTEFQKFIPWIALALLLFIGGKMIIESIKNKKSEDNEAPAVGFAALMIQGIATSIDALSVGFTISELPLSNAITEALIIGVVTFAICICGLLIGRKFGTKLSNKATLFGGLILIGIGIEIFIKGVFFS